MAGGTKSFNKLRNALHELLKCPVCLDRIRIPFKLCAAGHVTCCDCDNTSRHCSTCKAPFTMENPIVMKKLIEMTFQACKYSTKGCREVVEPGNDHKSFCGYRPWMCESKMCKVVQVRDILRHYEEIHKLKNVKRTDKTFCIANNYKLNEDFYKIFVISVCDNMFWIVVWNDRQANEMRTALHVAPVGKLEEDYHAKISYSHKDFVYTHTVKATVLSDCMIKPSLARERSTDYKDLYIFKLSLEILKNNGPNSTNNLYEFSCTIFSKNLDL